MSTPETMDALVCTAHGEPSGLKVAPAPVPVPKAGQVLIAVEAAGISYVDVLMGRNAHQNKHAVPFSPGMEVAGRIAALGEGVTEFAVGQSVAALVYDGGHAPFVAASVTETFALPAGCDPVRTAGLLSVALTADLALAERARLQPGETVLVGGAAGGVGICAIQLARHMGARVIAATSDEARGAVAVAAGAHAALTYGEAFRERFQALNEGRDADVIVDPVGGAFAEAAANLLDWDGRYVVIGFAGGTVPSFAANRLLVKNRAVLGLSLGHYRWRKPQVLARSAERVLAAIAGGALDGPLTIVDGLGAVPEILGRIAARQQLGKAVVRL